MLKKKENRELAENSAEQDELQLSNRDKIRLINQAIAKLFNINDTFTLTKLDDKGDKVVVGFSNYNMEVTFKIHDLSELLNLVED